MRIVTSSDFGVPEYDSFGFRIPYPQQIFDNMGALFAAMAKETVPVDTGNLQSSIGYEVGYNYVTFYADAEYADYVEYGTSRQSAQPYFEEAVMLAVAIGTSMAQKMAGAVETRDTGIRLIKSSGSPTQALNNLNINAGPLWATGFQNYWYAERAVMVNELKKEARARAVARAFSGCGLLGTVLGAAIMGILQGIIDGFTSTAMDTVDPRAYYDPTWRGTAPE